MYRLRLRYRDGLAVEERFPAINDGEARRALSRLFEVSVDLTNAEVLTPSGRMIIRLKRDKQAT